MLVEERWLCVRVVAPRLSTTVWHEIFPNYQFFCISGNKFSPIQISDFTAGNKLKRISVLHVQYLYITTGKYNIVLFILLKIFYARVTSL